MGEATEKRGMTLSQDELDACRDAFNKFDADQSGTIDATELRNVLAAMGQEPTDEELFQMIAECDKDCSGDIDMPEFLDMIERSAQRAELWDDEQDALDAFAACGGEADGTGNVSRSKLIGILHSLGITEFPIDRMIDMVDLDNSGLIDFMEFKYMLTSPDVIKALAKPPSADSRPGSTTRSATGGAKKA